MRLRSYLLAFAIVSLGAVACGDGQSVGESTEGPSSSAPDRSQGSEATQRRQAIDEDRQQWIAAGDGSRLDVVSSEGVPENVTGRFVNDGNGTSFASTGTNGWLVVSDDGWVQLVDAEGKPLDESRSVLGGSPALLSVHKGNDEWLVSSAAGEIERVNPNGQPTQVAKQPFGTDTVTAASFGDSQWLVASENGEFVGLSPTQLQEQARPEPLPTADKVVSLVRTGSDWLAFTETDYTTVSTGGPGELETIATDRVITTVQFAGGEVAVGSDDGRVLVAEPANLGSVSWENALDGSRVRDIAHDGSEWLAVGDDGSARLLDSSGAPQGSVVTLAGGRTLRGVRSLPDGWMVAIAGLSVVQSIDDQLEPPSNDSNILDGAIVRDVAVGNEALLAVGDGGAYRLLETDGTPRGDVQTLSDGENLYTAGWNGEGFMVAGAGGRVALVSPEGELDGSFEHLDGTPIPTLSWSGNYWLIVGEQGTFQRLRKNGEVYESSGTVGLDSVEYAEFNGDEWMIVGAQGTQGAFAIVAEDATVEEMGKTIEEVDGTLRALDWSGREWLAGGDGGIVARIGQSGDLISGQETEGIRDVLYGNPVRSIEFNGEIYLVGGAYGAVRKLQFDTLPIRPAIALNDFEAVQSLEWANPRGFPGGPCVSRDFCLSGACVGGIASGFCCESACNGPCESCFSEETGEPDGTCAPVPAGESPPERKDQNCGMSPEEQCGRTGQCDGQGACAFWGSDVQCAEPSCEEGVRRSASHCNGMGDCVVDEETECAPVTKCASSGAECATSCEGTDECAGEMVCLDGECVDPEEQQSEADAGTGDVSGEENGGNGGGGNGGGNGGGCTNSGPSEPVSWWLAFLGLVACARFRSRTASRSRIGG